MNGNERIRVVIADDHPLSLTGMLTLMEAMHSIVVLGTASGVSEAMRLVERESPDVVVTRFDRPDSNGVDFTSVICREFPETRVVLIKNSKDREAIRSAFLSGVSGYLLEESCVTDLERAVSVVADGEVYLSPSIATIVIEEFVRSREPQAPREATLTARQIDVLRLITQGHTTKEIARQLNLSVKTVDAHRTMMMTRLDIHNVAGLTRYAIRTGIVHQEK